MPVTHNVSTIRQGKELHLQNSEREPGGYFCATCGGERYHLVLIAEALNNRVRLIRGCSICNASDEIIEDKQTASKHSVSYAR